MSLSLKIGSLVIRTLAKPVGNWIKGQAREHEPFRRRCIAFAQALHRFDMHMRLGLLQDPTAIDRQIEREAAEASSKRRSAPTVPTEAEAKVAADVSAKEKKEIADKVRSEEKRKEARRIRPLSEAKAIDSGATFISEAFLFLVAAGLIGFETLRARRKTEKTRNEVDERLERVEEELKKAGEDREGLVGIVDGLRRELDAARGKPQVAARSAVDADAMELHREERENDATIRSTPGAATNPQEGKQTQIKQRSRLVPTPAAQSPSKHDS